MYKHQSKALLFIFLSIVSTLQAAADTRSMVIKSGNTFAAFATALTTIFCAKSAYNEYALTIYASKKYPDQPPLEISKAIIFWGSFGTLTSLYTTGYITYKTYFEKEPVCQTCTSSQSQQK